MTATTYLITGANRGLGLEYASQILAREPDARVIATVRKLATADGTKDELAKLEHKYDGRVERLQMDIGDLESVAKAAEAAKGMSFAKDGIDVLICNAGILAGGFEGPLQPNAITYLAENLKVNVVGTAATIDAFLPLVRKGRDKKIVIIGTRAAAFASTWSDAVTSAAYTTSKAGLHMWGVKLARALAPAGVTVIVLSPGWVQTEMGGDKATITAQESVEKTLAMLAERKPEDGGKLWNYDGEQVGW